MNQHRRGADPARSSPLPRRTAEAPRTLSAPRAADPDDLPGLAREAGIGLTRTAEVVDEQLAAVAATAASNVRRGLLLGLVAVSVVLAAVIVLLLYALDAAQQAGRDVASVTASGELDAVRQANITNARIDLVAANDALARAGLTTVPDPGPSASSQDLTAAVGEARGTLRAIGELQARGLPLAGVSVPDPRTGTFPSITPDRRTN